MENINTKNGTNINYVKFINLNTLLGKNKNIFFEEIFEDRYWDTSDKKPRIRRYFKRSCSCGYEDFVTGNSEDEIRSICPKCGTGTILSSRHHLWEDVKFKKEKVSLIDFPDFWDDYTKNSRRGVSGKEETTFRYVSVSDLILEKKKIAFVKQEKKIVYSILNGVTISTPANRKNVKYDVVIDFGNPLQPYSLKENDKEMPVNLNNLKKCVSNIEMSDLPSTDPDNLDIFHATAKYLSYADRHIGFAEVHALSTVVRTLYHYPELEVVFDACEDLECLRNIPLSCIQKGKTSPHEIVGLSKSVWNTYRTVRERARGFGVNFDQILDIYNKYGTDWTNSFLRMCYQIYSRYSRTGDIEKLAALVFTKKYSIKRLTTYLRDDIYIKQGIGDPMVGIRILYDYVNMCTEMNCSYEKDPKSLKMAHDIAMKNYSFVINPEDRKKFDKIVNQEYYKKLEYSGSDYIIVAPKSIEEIIQDAKKLRHCGDSYIIPLLQGRTNLYFMRKKTAPDKPWITIEVKYNTVEQYACFGDELPEKDVVNRINEWKKVKKLR